MVLIKNPIKSIALALVIGSLMFLNGCKTEEVEPTPKFSTDLLIGDWLVTEVDGQPYDVGVTLIYSFETSGGVKTCVEYVDYPDWNECNDGDTWEWEDANQSALILSERTASDDTKWEVTLLDETRLEIISIDDTDDTFNTPVKFIKVI
jgi:hypothetical protein